MFSEHKFSRDLRRFSRQTGITDPKVDNWLEASEYPSLIRSTLIREYQFTRPEYEGYWVRYPADRAQLKGMYHWWKPEVFARQIRFQEYMEPVTGEWQYDTIHHSWYRMFTVDRRVMAERDVQRYYQYMQRFYGEDLVMETKKVDERKLFRMRVLGSWQS